MDTTLYRLVHWNILVYDTIPQLWGLLKSLTYDSIQVAENWHEELIFGGHVKLRSADS
jgi:hypothetical protein